MLKIYNTLTGKKENFKPLFSNIINIYVCGPTVYDDIHIGNARPLIFFNMLKKYLQNLNFQVNYAVNITDIDDKIIKVAMEKETTEKFISNKYINCFLNILKHLELDNIDYFPKVTDFIPEIISYIEKLILKGYAYINDQGVYFRVGLISNYGKLGSKIIKDLKKNNRKEFDSQKENHQDFILWKKTKFGIKYKSPWFEGRPGWHTECLVMIKKIFNVTLDIHGGGNDLKFPHHENELAQSIAYDGNNLSNFFIHIGRIDYKKVKMSKSLGNVILVKKLLKEFNSNAIKLLIISHYYRQPIDFNYFLMEQFAAKYEKINNLLQKNNFILKINNIFSNQLDTLIIKKFYEYMNDDLNTPNVISLIEKGLKIFHKNIDFNTLSQIQNTLIFILNILGIEIFLKPITEETIEIYHLWQKEFKCRNFEKSDYYRKILVDLGFI
ncbi:cysteine--tRNA ligase [Candidatus Phytoplasma pyri]|uniref:cysteine--tRNA ligase n=1 Tax=Candidatus Phytoplasma pyri TaxID=47566 RepID=UPI00398328B9